LDKINAPEIWHPLRVSVCQNCWLVQTKENIDSARLFTSDYVYFSGYSKTWVQHAKDYALMLNSDFGKLKGKFFVEIASNDGTFVSQLQKYGMRVLGIEPTQSTAAIARSAGIETLDIFLTEKTAKDVYETYGAADFIAANNVLAHVPNLNDFVAGIRELLANDGIATIEFPHLVNLIANLQFDTIYHEHFSYFSLLSVEKIFETNGLGVFDLQQIAVHGGSLRVFVKRKESINEVSSRVSIMRNLELNFGLHKESTYKSFASDVSKLKLESLKFLVSEKIKGKTIVGYGAAAKGNTFLNYLGIKSDLISFIVDANVNKQNKFTPGSRIPVVSESRLKAERPDFVVIFPWNLTEEISNQLSYIREWGGEFVVFVPELDIF